MGTQTYTNNLRELAELEVLPGVRVTFGKLAAAIDRGDVKMATEILHPDNKRTRAAFERATGIKLPKTVGGTDKTVADWMQASKAD